MESKSTKASGILHPNESTPTGQSDEQFKKKVTTRFMERMRPHAHDLYRQVFPGCVVEDCREDGKGVHVLDKFFGIDTIVHLQCGAILTMQEKYRENSFLEYLDFTQGYMSGAGTEFERPGEWFKLAADLYFYGWANKDETGFEKWFLMDIVKYKLLVEAAGGLKYLGNIKNNGKHGRTSFYAIPVKTLLPCFVATYKTVKPKGLQHHD